MDYEKYFTVDELFAIRELEREFVGTENGKVRALFYLSIGRVFIREWAARDHHAGGLCDTYTDQTGRFHQVDGTHWKARTGSTYVGEDLKWERRVRAWLSDNYLTVLHIVAWLISSVQSNALWISRLDERGRPLKLMKCGNIARLSREADKAMEKENSRVSRNLMADLADERTFGTFSEYTVVVLESPRALDLEGRRLQHCIGHGRYDNLLSDPERLFASVRKEGVPVATIEATRHEDGNWYILQAVGYRNSNPSNDVIEVLTRELRFRTYAEFLAVKLAERIPDQERVKLERGARPTRL